MLYICTHLLSPFLIEAAPKVFAKLGTPAVPIERFVESPTLANLRPGYRAIKLRSPTGARLVLGSIMVITP